MKLKSARMRSMRRRTRARNRTAQRSGSALMQWWKTRRNRNKVAPEPEPEPEPAHEPAHEPAPKKEQEQEVRVRSYSRRTRTREAHDVAMLVGTRDIVHNRLNAIKAMCKRAGLKLSALLGGELAKFIQRAFEEYDEFRRRRELSTETTRLSPEQRATVKELRANFNHIQELLDTFTPDRIASVANAQRVQTVLSRRPQRGMTDAEAKAELVAYE